MSITKGEPFRDLLALREKMNRLLEESSVQETGERLQGRWTPPVDIYETDDSVIIQIDVPGLSREDIQIEVKGDALNVRGERRLQKDVKQQNFYVMERAYGSFSRSFTLPADVEAEKAWAKFLNGVLEIHIPKGEKPKPRRIKVSVE